MERSTGQERVGGEGPRRLTSLQAGILAQEKQGDVDGIADSVGDNGNGEVAATGKIHQSQNQPIRTLRSEIHARRRRYGVALTFRI